MSVFHSRYVGAVIGCIAAAAFLGSGGVAAAAGKAADSLKAAHATIKVAYGGTYCFDTTALTKQWWNQVKSEFQKAHPGVTVQLEPIPGSYNTIVDKLSLLYKSASTAPTVAEIPTGQIGLWAQSGYLLPMNKYLKRTPWWKTFPKVIQSEGRFSGKVYAVNQGENDSALLYNQTMFKKAGIPLPWKPKKWATIIAAAKKVKAAEPTVIPLWLNAGTGSGANGLLQGINNLIVGTATPTIEAKNGKLVVDSPGIRQALTFYKQALAAGLDAPVSTLFSPNAVTAPLSLFAKGKLAMAVGSNYYGGNWTKFINAPYWATAPKEIGEAAIPTYNGKGVASTLGGWDYSISSHTKHAKLSMDFVSLMEDEANSIDAANWAGWVPPDRHYWTATLFTKFAPPYQAFFANITPHATLTPSSANYSVWVQAMGEATGLLARKPTTSVATAVKTLESYVKNQLTPTAYETLK